MNKQDFINVLRATLNGRVSAQVLADNVTYYEDYINTQIRMGRTEKEVLESLGDPRLIARTIIDTQGRTNQGAGAAGGKEKQSTAYREAVYQQKHKEHSFGSEHKIPGVLVLILVFVFIFLLLGLVLSVVSFFAPFLLVMLLVWFLIKLFRDWLN